MDTSNSIIKEFDTVLDTNIPNTINFLCEMIKYQSTRGNEGEVNRFIFNELKEYCDKAELIQIPDSFISHPEYRWPLNGLTYRDTQNVRINLSPSKKIGRSLIINAHSDIVPASKNQPNAFNPKIEHEVIYGRGACDDKGQIAILYLLLRTLKELNLKPAGEIIIDIVIEEENGGNGTLFSLQNQINADAALVLEPTDLKILISVRGAVWFELKCYGRPAHSGSPNSGISALKTIIQAMNILEEYHDELLKKSRGLNKLFDQFENPMPLTFGTLSAGDWPATVPATATVRGVFGFLPNMTVDETQRGIVESLLTRGNKWLQDNFKINFNMLNNEGSQIPDDHSLVEALKLSVSEAGITPEVSAMTAACDAWQYVHRKGIPAVVIGAGSLSHAHSNIEQIEIESIRNMAKILYNFIDKWSGYISEK